MREKIDATLDECVRLMRAFGDTQTELLEKVATEIANSLSKGGKLILFGNGGSAADAQHIAAEFVNKLSRPRPGMAALALSVDTSVLTSIANDISFDDIFSRQIEVLGKAEDVALAISTSGKSPNILKGIEAARQIGMATVGVFGKDGGSAATMVRHAVVVPHNQTQRIQEVHILIGHLLAELVEDVIHPAHEAS